MSKQPFILGARPHGDAPASETSLVNSFENFQASQNKVFETSTKVAVQNRRLEEILHRCLVLSKFQIDKVDLNTDTSVNGFLTHIECLGAAHEKLCEREKYVEELTEKNVRLKILKDGLMRERKRLKCDCKRLEGDVSSLTSLLEDLKIKLERTLRWKDELERVVRELGSETGLRSKGTMSLSTLREFQTQVSTRLRKSAKFEAIVAYVKQLETEDVSSHAHVNSGSELLEAGFPPN